MMKKILLALTLLSFCAVCFGCCSHLWRDATFESPKTCTVCGAERGKPLEAPKTFCKNDVLYTGSFEMSFVSVEAIDELRPASAENGYMYFTAEDGKTMYDVTFTVKAVSDITVSDRVSVALLGEDSRYIGFCILENTDGTELFYGNTKTVAASETYIAHFLINVDPALTFSVPDVEVSVVNAHIRCTGEDAEEGSRLHVGD